jgi:ribonuclease HII
MVRQVPTFTEEERLIAQGYRLIAGIDEVGRGPLAGPVLAAAVILPLEERPSWLSKVRDSKQLTASQRESIFDHIMESGIAFGVGVVSHEVIDARGIAPATRLAMRRAVEQLSTRPDYLLIDYMRLPGIRIPQKGVTDGDSLCVSIATASIVAKVTRDRMMVELDSQYPGYGLAQHKGYGTPEHLEALQKLGPCTIHRKTFEPVRKRLI